MSLAGMFLIKAAKYDRTQIRTDEQGRSWAFNNETNRWRIQREAPGASSKPAKAQPATQAEKPSKKGGSAAGLTRKIGTALKGGPAHVDDIERSVSSKKAPISRDALESHIQSLVKRGKLFDHGDGVFGREPAPNTPAPVKEKQSKPNPGLKPKAKSEKPQKAEPVVVPPSPDEKPPEVAKTEGTPTLKSVEYNPHAIKDLAAQDFVDYRRNVEGASFFENPDAAWNQPYDQWAAQASEKKRSRGDYVGAVRDAIRMGWPVSPDILSAIKPKKADIAKNDANRSDWEGKKRQIERIQRAATHPLMDAEETKGYKPLMSEEEAAKYTAGSFTGNLKFYHGNDKAVTQSVANDGVNADLNNKGIFGKGFYLAASKAEACYYSLNAQDPDNTEVISTQVKVKNPYVATAEDISRLGQWFPGDQSNNIDSTSVTNYLRAKGHDSIYLADYGYFVAFEGKQVASYKVQAFEGGLKTTAEEKQAHSLKHGWDSTVEYSKASKTGAALLKAKRQPPVETPSDEDLQELL
jgi:hypothetical protein